MSDKIWLDTCKYTISSACRLQHHRISNSRAKYPTAHFSSDHCYRRVSTCSRECCINYKPTHICIFIFPSLHYFWFQDANTNYLFTFGTPGSGYFFGARVNPVNSDYLDMRLEGDATGWVAVGFTETSSMVGVQGSVYWGGGEGEDSPRNSLASLPKIANELLITEPEYQWLRPGCNMPVYRVKIIFPSDSFQIAMHSYVSS